MCVESHANNLFNGLPIMLKSWSIQYWYTLLTMAGIVIKRRSSFTVSTKGEEKKTTRHTSVRRSVWNNTTLSCFWHPTYRKFPGCSCTTLIFYYLIESFHLVCGPQLFLDMQSKRHMKNCKTSSSSSAQCKVTTMEGDSFVFFLLSAAKNFSESSCFSQWSND